MNTILIIFFNGGLRSNLRPIKDKIVINIEVTPETRFHRMWDEYSDGKKKYFSGNRIIAKQLMKNIKDEIDCVLHNNFGDVDDKIQDEVISNFNEDYPFEDFEPENYTDLVKEVKITWQM